MRRHDAGLSGGLAELVRQAAARFPGWSEVRFRALVEGPGRAVARALQAAPDRGATLDAYLRLLAEGVGAGMLDPAPGAGGAATRVLLELAPRDLPRIPAGSRVAALARAWNLVEGVAAQAAWLQAWVAGGADELRSLESLPEDLVAILDLGRAEPGGACWGAARLGAVLDPRGHDEDFLPGRIHLSQATLACVHDRIRPDVHLSVGLRRGGRSRFLGVGPCRDGSRSVSQVRLRFQEDAVRIREPVDVHPCVPAPEDPADFRESVVDAPRFGAWHSHYASAAGFLVMSAEDSQRVWVVEAA